MNNTELGIGDNTVLCTNPARAALHAAVLLTSLDCVASPHHYQSRSRARSVAVHSTSESWGVPFYSQCPAAAAPRAAAAGGAAGAAAPPAAAAAAPPAPAAAAGSSSKGSASTQRNRRTSRDSNSLT